MIEVHRDVDVLGGEDGGRSTSRDERLELGSIAHSPGRFEDLAKRRSDRELVGAGPLDMSGDAVELGPGVALVGAESQIPVHSALDDVRHVAQRLDVVDHGGATEGADHRGEGGLDSWLAALALEGLEQSGLLTADVGPGAAVHVHLLTVAGAHRVLAEHPVRVGVRDRLLENLRRLRVLAADVDVGGVCPDGVAADRTALDQLVRVFLHQQPVFEGPGLRFVRIADQIDGLAGVLWDEAPFEPRRKARSATAAQTRGLHRIDDLFGLHLIGLSESAVAARRPVALHREHLRVADVAGQYGFVAHQSRVRRSSRTSSGVRFSW